MVKPLYSLAQTLGVLLLKRQLHCAVAESCTGGLLASVITEIPDSSQWFDRGFITYSNHAKQQMLAVPITTLEMHGAVSEATACAMAEGALLLSDVDISVAITGLAGPKGGSVEQPVGTVWIAWARHGEVAQAYCYHFAGERSAIRQQAVEAALQGLIRLLATSEQGSS